MKELKKHLEEFELIRRACSGEEGEVEQTLIRRAVQGWALSGHRRLKEIDSAVREARDALNGPNGNGLPRRCAPRNDRRRRLGGAHLRREARA